MSVLSHVLICIPLAAVPSAWVSAIILLTLGVIFTASWMTFWILVERSTAQRGQVLLSEWARERDFREKTYPHDHPPKPLDVALQRGLAVQACFESKRMSLCRMESFGSTAGADAPAARAGLWNLLICEIPHDWPPTGLRPVSAAVTLLDLFSLTSFPLLGNTERFVVLGTGTKAAAALSKSAARGLLPPDIGLLLHGRKLVLDFTSRPFDTVEFERMIAIAEQIMRHLPPPGSGE